MMELTKEANRFQLMNYGDYSWDSALKLSKESIIQALKDLIRQTGTKTRDVVASIPSFPTFATTITMPYLSEEEIAKAMPFEARKYIPVPLSEVQLDWAIVNVKKEQRPQIADKDPKSAPTIDVFLVAVPKEEVARYQYIMKEAGLNLCALELENFALIRALVGNDLSPIAIVNIGGRSTSILIVENGFQRVNRDYEIGGFEITKTIAQSLGVDLKRAEELKKTNGLRDAETTAVQQAMESLIDMMAFETNKTIHNYEDQRKTKIGRILLVGGLANMIDFKEYFAKKLGRDVALGNSLARVVMSPALERVRDELNSTFVVSIGLAMREI